MEQCFGLRGNTPPIVFRNWVTFLLRECLSTFENIAFHNKLGWGNLIPFQHYFNARFALNVQYWERHYTRMARTDLFQRHFLFSPLSRDLIITPPFNV